MKKLLAATLGVAAMLGAAAMTTTSASAEDLKIRWGTSPGYEPFIYKKPDGSLTGFDYEFGEALCKEMKAECTWVEQAWDGIIPALQANNYDAILGSMSITPKRQEVIDFTIPYQRGVTRFVAKEGATFNDARGEMKGVKIGVQAGTTEHDYLKAYYPDAEIKTYPSQDEVWLDMKAGRVEATVVGFVLAKKVLESDKGAGLAIFGSEHKDEKIFGPGAGIGVRKDDTDLRDKISAAILALRANGEYQKINANYFDIDIYGEE